MTQDHNEAGRMKAPNRRDISARQDLLGKELRELFDDYTHEDMPDELLKLAAQLQGAFEAGRRPDVPATAPAASPTPSDTPQAPVSSEDASSRSDTV
ncbi:hypothetical protein [Azorhizobium sp. AG788]|uniref:hypothetical protein n=1 Tax=Azorhizobium sp. AG788 TaxID=2183897 RepID=UPI00105C8E57|nr:hypothetical protein [Azorhizobium sp. AG788]